MMKTLTVTNKYNEKKLSKFLTDNIPNFNFGTFCMLLRKKDIKINGKRINKDCSIHENDKVVVYIADEKLNANIKLKSDANKTHYEVGKNKKNYRGIGKYFT